MNDKAVKVEPNAEEAKDGISNISLIARQPQSIKSSSAS